MTTAPQSDTRFLVLHAVRLKGVAPETDVARIAGIDEDLATSHLEAAHARDEVQRLEGRRNGYKLTAPGREQHAELLAKDAADPTRRAGLKAAYDGFLPLNGRLKDICGTWQMRDGEPNDHTDADYDAAVVAGLADLHGSAAEVLSDAARSCERLNAYVARFSAALDRVKAGELAAFARPMADSYHDAWMELHQDLLLSLGRERGEGDGH